MGYRFNDWKKILEDFQGSVEKDLKEIRKHKAEVQQMKAELAEELNSGKYIRDKKRIVLSAPEIVIGNVDKSGNLLGESGYVIVRANNIGLHGVGTAGAVHTYAPSIHQIAVDTGLDGNEAVVGPVSEIVSQARGITLQANEAEDTFPQMAASAGAGNISIHADSMIDMAAVKSAENLKKSLENRINDLKTHKGTLDKMAKDAKKRVDDVTKELDKLLTDADKLRGENDEDVRGSYVDIVGFNEKINLLIPELNNAIDSYSQILSRLAETNRQTTSLETLKGKIKTGDDFKKKTTNTLISLSSESVFVTSTDGDGNLRDNDEAIVSVTANKVNVGAREHDGSLKDKGEIQMNAKTIGVSTVSTKMKDEKEGESQALGDVIINSKTVTVQAVDNEIKDKKPKEKALTKDSILSIRMEKTALSATDTEGKATGSVKVNSKLVEVKSMDVDKEKRTDKELAKDSKMLLVSEKMFLGARDKQVKSKKVQAMSEEVGIFADKTLEAQQGEKKAVMQLADGKAALSGSETQVYGKTTINAATEVKGEVKAPKGTFDGLQANSQFKSPNISDGMGAPGGGGGGSLSAKLTAEDGPKEA